MKMISLRIAASALTFALCMSCASLNYPVPEPEADSSPTSTPTRPVLIAPPPETSLTWRELIRSAREHRRLEEYPEARERLDQAGLMVASLSPRNAQRRTVFSIQARLAEDFTESGQIEEADDLANQLFAEAEIEPELGGAALVSLALSVADRREQAAIDAGLQESQLLLLQIALTTAQTGASSRDRINLAWRVANEAFRENDLELARRGIDQALTDAHRVIPSKKETLTGLHLYKARIALGQADLDAAEASAISANQMIAELEPNASQSGIAEGMLAEILAEKGEVDRALILARGAYARIGGEEPVSDHAQRRIIASLARVERSELDYLSARQHLEQALAIPPVDFEPDADLIMQLRIELQTLDDLDPPPLSTPEFE
jgi:hypothetical protein